VATTSDALAQALLQRLRALGRVERAVLFRAAVIGRRFRLTVLCGTIALSEERVRAALEKAGDLQLIVVEDDDGDWYAFRHALTRDIAYDEFIETQVRPIHRRITRVLERQRDANGSALDDLAYHSWAAGDATRCVRYNEQAGDRAAAIFATADARTYYSRAREFAGEHSEPYRRLTDKLVALEIRD
jgi:eukaryotic-like serine/threonine-protein kinase